MHADRTTPALCRRMPETRKEAPIMHAIRHSRILCRAATLSAALILAAALAGCSSSASSAVSTENAANANLEKTDFAVGYLNSTAHLFAFVAQEEGYFAEEGLDTELIQFSSSSELESGLQSGKLDVAFISTVPTFTFASNGSEISIFGGAMTNGHGYVIKPEFTEGLSDWDISILKDRTVASVKNSIQDAELQQLLDAANIEIGDGEGQVHLRYFDSQKDAYAALKSNEIDAASVYSPYASLAEEDGYDVVYRCSEEALLQDQPCCRQIALTSALENRPNSYVAFERAIIKAYEFSQTNREQTIQDIKNYIDIDESAIDTEVYGGYGTSYPDPDTIASAALKDAIVSLGYTDDFDVDSHFNTSVYKAALDSLTEQDPENEILQELQTHFTEAN